MTKGEVKVHDVTRSEVKVHDVTRSEVKVGFETGFGLTNKQD